MYERPGMAWCCRPRPSHRTPAAGAEVEPGDPIAPPPNVMAALELLSGLGYRVCSPNELVLKDGPTEWNE